MSTNDEKALPAFSIPSPDLPGAPKIPRLAVLRPYCETKVGNIDAGSAVATAFVVKLDNQPAAAVTVLSLLSKANGLSRDVLAGEIGDIVSGSTLGSAFGEIDGVIIADKVFAIQTPIIGDLLAITLPEGEQKRVGSLQIADELPVVGSKVWMSAALYAGAPPSQRQHLAEVTGLDQMGRLAYKFDNPSLSLQGTAGAPMLNEAGEVVAIHLSGDVEAETIVGFGNPTATWKSNLEAALRQ